MSCLFSEIVIPDDAENYEFLEEKQSWKRLRFLSKINVFVGANNSGKSRLMRSMASVSNLKVVLNLETFGSKLSWGKLVELLQSFRKDVVGILTNMKAVGYWEFLEPQLDRFPDEGYLTQGENLIPQWISLIDTLQKLQSPSLTAVGSNPTAAASQIRPLAEELYSKLSNQSLEKLEIPVTRKLYIPTLRSLRDVGNRCLADRTKKDYFENSKQVEIFSGEELYKEIEKLLRGDLNARETLRRFETWLGETFIRGETVALIPRMGQTTLTIKIGDEPEQPIHMLGDGIQAILILAFPLFVRESDDLLVFIEEPELFLHPWLQRVYLEMLMNKFERHQYFLATHSNHFLDLTLVSERVSVFTFEKRLTDSENKEKPPRFIVRNVSRTDHRPLELLGVQNSSVLLTNCTIWVEGITDRRYLTHWLRLYQEQLVEKESNTKSQIFKEDLHFSFVEYSGSNTTHWSFLNEVDGIDATRLCGKLFLVADQDNAESGSKKSERHEKLEKELGDRFYLLPVVEIENLLTPDVIVKVLESFGEKRSNLNKPNQADYANEKLGEYIDKQIIKDPSQLIKKPGYQSENGSIRYKIKFCEKAIKAMARYEELSDGAKAITEKIYDFIKSNNQG